MNEKKNETETFGKRIISFQLHFLVLKIASNERYAFDVVPSPEKNINKSICNFLPRGTYIYALETGEVFYFIHEIISSEM